MASLGTKAVQEQVVAEVKRRLGPRQLELPGLELDVAGVVAKTTEQVVIGTIDIPRIIVVPKDEVRSGFKPFKLDLEGPTPQPGSDDIVDAQRLRTGEQETITSAAAGSMSSG